MAAAMARIKRSAARRTPRVNIGWRCEWRCAVAPLQRQAYERASHGYNMMNDAPVWPTELRLHKDRRTLTVSFENAQSFDLPAEYLRVKSPSAEVQGHSPDERKTVFGKKNVMILEVQPVGNYAV